MRPRTYSSEQIRSLDDITARLDAAQADRQAAFNRGFYWGVISGSAFVASLAFIFWAIQ